PARDGGHGRDDPGRPPLTDARKRTTPPPQPVTGWKRLGNDLLSHRVTPAVPSALEGLTAVFGMETGVSPPPLSPSVGQYSGRLGVLSGSRSALIGPREDVRAPGHGHLWG